MNSNHQSRSAAAALLRETRRILSSPVAWCQGHSAMTAAGRTVKPSNDRARRWCLHGALVRSAMLAGEPGALGLKMAYRALDEELPSDIRSDSNIVYWQDDDGREHGEILDLLDRAIVRVETDHGYPNDRA